jgi:hypothetical protein
MKKLLLSLIVFVGFVGIVCADNYTVAITSYVKTGGVTEFLANNEQVDGGVKIDKITFSTVQNVATPILIGVYDTSATTTTATADGYWVIIGTNTLGGSNSITIDYPYYNPLILHDPMFYKADGNTANTVYMNLQYR